MSKSAEYLAEYEINPYTMFIKPVIRDQRMYSEVYEVEDSYTVAARPLDIIERSCRYFGSSYAGRREGTKQLIGVTHKAPIMVEPHLSIFLFPTTSPSNEKCIWFSQDYISSYEKADSKSTIVNLRNHQSLVIPISLSSFENQLHRTSRLRITQIQNIKQMEQFKWRPKSRRLRLVEPPSPEELPDEE